MSQVSELQNELSSYVKFSELHKIANQKPLVIQKEGVVKDKTNDRISIRDIWQKKIVETPVVPDETTNSFTKNENLTNQLIDRICRHKTSYPKSDQWLDSSRRHKTVPEEI